MKLVPPSLPRSSYVVLPFGLYFSACFGILFVSILLQKAKSMAMWGNHVQRVNIVINDNIIEEVTDFKYLGEPLSVYKSDLEDKLRTYNKINGAIRRHFGKKNEQRNEVKNSQHYS